MGHPRIPQGVKDKIIAEFKKGGDNRDVDIARRLDVDYHVVSYITTCHTQRMAEKMRLKHL